MKSHPDRAPVIMNTLRFSRTVKRVIQGQGKTVDIMLEARVSSTYDAGAAVLDLQEINGRLKMSLHPQPEPVMILNSSTNQVEMAMPETETIVVDLAAMVGAEMEKAEERAVEILTPAVKVPSAKEALKAGSHMKHRLPVLDKAPAAAVPET